MSSPRKSTSNDPLQVMGCFNCGGNHLLSKCTQPTNAVRAAKKKMEYYAKKNGNHNSAHLVLFELCQQLEDRSVVDTDENADDVALFDALLASSCLTESPADNYHEQEPHTSSEKYETHFARSVFTLEEQETDFFGACCDTGATRSVIGITQAKDYLDLPCNEDKTLLNYCLKRRKLLSSVTTSMLVPRR